MKKVILSLVFVLATGTTLMNASSSNDEFLPNTTETIEMVEEFGCARDCVDAALGATFEDAVDNAELPSMDFYHNAYENCYYSNCVN
ncbi:hypothetical protein [Polaribacter sp. KT 15]|uniref:hypothetical protein n=1 Tax=Polaribacter sp. KT 15 TaxID=1896175 RepID=UPI00090A2EC2|nr:hypothetical protein [Polaribacter sp. KT 15]SHM91209.1 hypothetical protein SAMN05720268_1352 [Polaribacter sp. KT 15]